MNEAKETENQNSQIFQLKVQRNILEDNNQIAESIRKELNRTSKLGINLMSSPGSGKTSLLEKTAEQLGQNMAVMEGDLQTEKDADRIRSKGVRAYQITTGKTCHLDAKMLIKGLEHLDLNECDYFFIENVGNLVCPAGYDLGTHLNVVLLSVPEGDDKVEKYPVMFSRADIMLLTKYDLIEHFEFNTDEVIKQFKKINPLGKVITFSIHDKSSVQNWISILNKEYQKIKTDIK